MALLLALLVEGPACIPTETDILLLVLAPKALRCC